MKKMLKKIYKVLLSNMFLFIIGYLVTGCSLIPSNNPTSQLSGNCSILMNKLGAPFAYNSSDRIEDYNELKKDMQNCLSDARTKLAKEGIYIDDNSLWR